MSMSLPSFYYIQGVDATNFYLDFNEGSGPLIAEVASGNYTMLEMADAVESAMNAAGTNNYTVTFNRDARTYTISSTSNFSLLVATGVHVGADLFPIIGFTVTDRSGAMTYTGNLQAGSEYIPQFPLQSYVDQEDFQKAVSASINKSASGLVEVVKFGTEKFFEFNIRFITNIDQGESGPIVTNLSGLDDARAFMRFCIQKTTLEFMPDNTVKADFFNVLLEKTEADSNGTGYKMKELYGKGLPGYFETGDLTFRIIEGT